MPKGRGINMTLETILWTALIVVVSMAIGWILGNLYAISRINAKKRNKRKEVHLRSPIIRVEKVTQGDPKKA